MLLLPGCSPQFSFDAITLPPANQPAGEAYSAGRDILEEAQRAYRNIEYYDGTIDITGTTGYEGGKRPVQARLLSVTFNSPDYFYLRGPDSNGDPLAILIDGQRAEVKHAGVTESLPSAENALYAYSGVTLEGSTFLPGCLLDVSWENKSPDFPKDISYLAAWATKAILIGSTIIDGEDCHRVHCERETASWTIYVNKTSKLIEQVDFAVSVSQMKLRRKRHWGGGASGRVISMERTQVFRINEVRYNP